MLTIKHVLERAGDMPLADCPFAKDIYFALMMNNVKVDITSPASEILHQIGTLQGYAILNLPLDELSTGVDTQVNRTIVLWCFRLTMICIFMLTCITIYISFVKQEFPEFTLSALFVVIPAMVMWNKMNLLKSEKAKALGAMIGSIGSLRSGRTASENNPMTDMTLDELIAEKQRRESLRKEEV